jgi:hypothetical protein
MPNIVSVSWPDHLSFGEGDGQLDTPEKVARRMQVWRDELGATAMHWRMMRARIPGRFSAARGYRHTSHSAAHALTWDDFERVPSMARDAGLESWLYVSLFDEGWPLAPPRVRAVSYHNAMHAQHVAWQSGLTRTHPEWLVVDRSGRHRQWGVVSLAYPDARRALIDRWMSLIRPTRFDGLFVCLRSQSRPADHADTFGFNEPARAAYVAVHGGDVALDGKRLQAWRNLLGEYLTTLLVELRPALADDGRRLAVGAARGDVFGPPLGNATLQWREWVGRRIIDDLVIGQNSSQCPSMWHQLWPMHRGTGYLQNYLDGTGLPALTTHLRITYAPIICDSRTSLYVARQWSERSAIEEREVAAIPGVSGLVFSSFRHDNPGPIARGDWRGGRISADARATAAGPR